MTETPPPRPSGAGETALAVLLLALAAALPFVHALDLAVAPWVEAVRTCAGQRLFVGVSAWTRPVGFGLLVLVLGVRLARGASARAVVPTALAALLAGTLLVDVMKGAVDRPRPDAENLSWVGGAYPSGHVGNTVLCALVVVCLWRGAVGRRFGAGWLLALGAAVVVGTARVYTEHHSTCDVVGTTALVSGFAVLALAHPRPWVRAATIGAAAALSAGAFGATLAGWHLWIDGGVPTGRRLAAVELATALGRGALRGAWRAEVKGDVRRGVWLWAPAATIALGPAPGRVAAVRVVLRPRVRDAAHACSRLRVELNGAPLGQRLLHLGWRGYTFPVAGHWRGDGKDVLGVSVTPEGEGANGLDPPFAAFRTVTLHAAGGRGVALIRRSSGAAPPPRRGPA
ncbi:MAG TPA: phosphatase PAP2 family protein [Candidatus Binatia bacterium]|nr:phosphatase PAP2 family protein [Candidatus Binatia bacterium]